MSERSRETQANYSTSNRALLWTLWDLPPRLTVRRSLGTAGRCEELEGRLLGKFLQFCEVNADDREFLVIPLEVPAGDTFGQPTQAWCRPNGGRTSE